MTRRRSYFLLLLCACARGPTAGPVANPEPAVASTADPAQRCTLAAGEAELTVQVGELQRRYLVHVGAQLAATPAVVLAWHGFGSGPQSALRSMQAETLWDDAVVVAPQGEPRTFEQFGARARPGWQVAQGELDDRDLLFFDAIVGDLEARGCLDRKRIYSTGFSNGAFFTNVLACHRGGLLAAIAPAGGGGPFVPKCEGGPLPVLVTHGRNDEVVEHAMGERSFQHWAAHDGCGVDARAPADGCVDAPGCPAHAPVRMCSLAIAHEWPEGQAERTAEFLRRFTRP